MNEFDIKNALDKIVPDEDCKQKMLENILNNTKKPKKPEIYKRVVPVAALLAVVVCASLVANGILNNKFTTDSKMDSLDDTGLAAGHGNSTNEIAATYDTSNTMMAQVSLIYFDGRLYTLPYEQQLNYLGYSNTVTPAQVGEKISTAKSGEEVFRYLPAGCEAFVVVKQDGKDVLYAFQNFESYNNNQDEDASEYLKLYGANSAEDIAKIEVYNYYGDLVNPPAKSYDDSATITKFYGYFKDLKNSSDQYFNALFKYSEVQKYDEGTASYSSGVSGNTGGAVIAPDAVVGTEQATQTEPAAGNCSPAYEGGTSAGVVYPTKPADGVGQSTSGSVGSAGYSLADSTVFRICFKNGNYMDLPYYPNIQFLSRYYVGGEFSTMLENMR